MDQDKVALIRASNGETITWILGLKNKSKEIVKDFILENGIKSFLLNHENIEIELEEHEKIKVLKRIFETFDGDIEMINFGDMNEGC